MKDIFTISSSALPERSRVVGFRGVEALSRPYEFEIFVVMTSDDGAHFEMADAINAAATLSMHREDDRPPFVFHGMIASLELVHNGAPVDLGDGLSHLVVQVGSMRELHQRGIEIEPPTSPLKVPSARNSTMR